VTRDFRIPFLRDRRECEAVRSVLTDFLDADLDERMRRRVDRPVRFCPRCRRVLGNLRTTIDRLAHLEAPTELEPADDLVERISRSWRTSGGDSPPAP
jgi:predicted anti-sigma-YlaC factor YlaD